MGGSAFSQKIPSPRFLLPDLIEVNLMAPGFSSGEVIGLAACFTRRDKLPHAVCQFSCQIVRILCVLLWKVVIFMWQMLLFAPALDTGQHNNTICTGLKF